MNKVDKQKRKWLSLGGIVLGASVLPNSVLAMVSTPKPRILTFRNINTGLRNAEIEVICGYRSAATNAMRHRQSSGVASNSYHIKGKAIDFRIAGVPLTKVKAAAENLSNGGVGYYPTSNFIHVDTGPVRTWKGV